MVWSSENMKRKPDIKVKIILISLGLLFSLIFCEIFLCIFAAGNRALFLPKYDLTKIDKNNLVVFCLGDSCTYGIGAGFKYSYPAQLEKILNKTNKGRQVRVFNFGVPGYNSFQTLQTLKRETAQLKPDIVILLCGSNDNWNFNSVPLKHSFKAISSCLSRLKTYEMLIVFGKNFQYRISQKDNLLNNQKYAMILKEENDFLRLIRYGNIFRCFNFYDEARLFYNKAMMLRHDEPIGYIELGRCYKLNHEYRQSIYILGQALRQWPENNDLQLELKDVFIKLGITEETIEFYENFLSLYPANKSAAWFLASQYIKFAGDCFLDNKLDKAKDYYKKALLLDSKQSPAIFEAIEMMEKSYKKKKDNLNSNFKLNLGNWGKVISGNYFIQTPIGRQLAEYSVVDSLAAMIEICKKNNIKIILSEYPAGSEDSSVCKAIKKVALIYGIPIVDHRDAFYEALKYKPYESYFVSRNDPHCTKEGYRIMAENIAEQILKSEEDKF
jgi:tetratricopeptide (TPR) repeat protein